MNDDRTRQPGRQGESPERPGFAAADDALAIDFRALRERSARDQSTLNHTMHTARLGRERTTRGGFVMSLFQSMKTRPMFSTLALGGVIAAALLIVPISYVRTVGQEVALTMSSPGLDKEVVQKIANEYREALQSDGVRVALEVKDDGTGAPARIYRLETSVAERSRAATERVAAAFANALSERGITAAVAVTPRTERVSGNVYAAAGNSIINLTIDRRGKTADQIRESITSQLTAAGIENPDVNVTLDGNQTTVKIKADNACGDSGTTECEFRLRVEGEGAGNEEAHMVTFQCDPNATCDQMREQIKEQLRSRGVDAEVSVTGQCGDGQGCTGACEVEVKVEARREQQ